MDPRRSFDDRGLSVSAFSAVCGWAALILAATTTVSPGAWIGVAVVAVASWMGIRGALRRAGLRAGSSGRSGEPTLVLGDPDDVVRVVRQLAHHPEAGARPVATAGWSGDVPTALPHEDGRDLLAAIQRRRVRHVVIASAAWVDAASELFGPGRPEGLRVSIAPRAEVARRETTLIDLCGVPYLSVAPRSGESVPTCARTRAGAPVGVDAGLYADRVEGVLAPTGEPVDVSVVVVTHESARDIVGCLDSVGSLTDAASREVIVVDNASTDGTPQLVAAVEGVRLVRKRRRDGFSVNCNIGVACSSGRYVLFLNPDTTVKAGAVDALVAHLDRHPEVGAVAPQLRYPDGRPQASARCFPSPLTTVVRRTPLRRWLRNHADSHLVDCEFEGVRDIDWCLGAALLVRSSALHQLRGLDDGYRLYCEDIDLCWRLREAGWAVQQVSDAVVTHALGELTSKRFLTRATWWHLRSVARFGRLHGLAPARASAAGIERHVPSVEPMIDVGGSDLVIDIRDVAEAER